MIRFDYQTAVSKAKSLRDIGIREVYLDRGPDLAFYPWHLVTEVKAGGTYRLNTPVSVTFKAEDPDTGLSFIWHIDIEPRDNRGSSTIVVDTGLLFLVGEQLKGAALKQYLEALGAVSDSIQGSIQECQNQLRELNCAARDLQRLCTGEK